MSESKEYYWAGDGNVFIFNLNENNERNVKLLEETFEKFNCITKVYEKPTKSEIEQAVQKISKTDFTLFEYIVVIVLDKRNPSGDIIRTSDNQIVMLRSEFQTKILTNKTLCGKKKLFLLQMNRTYPSDEDDLRYEQKIKAEARVHQPDQPLYSRYKFELYACEDDMELPENEYENDIFIKAFCEVFSKYGSTKKMCFMAGELAKDLRNRSYSETLTILKSSDAYFKNAMEEETMKDFYKEQYRKLKEWKSQQLTGNSIFSL